MERMERLYLLLAYGFGGLILGFLTIMILAFSSFPFNPGTPVAFVMTIGVFALAFYGSAKIVSKYMTFSSDDVHFLMNLAFFVGLSVIALDIVMGGTKFTTLLSNLSFLAAFLACTNLFLKPKAENEVISVKPYALILYTSSVRMLQSGARQLYYRLRSSRGRYAQKSA
jgi:hypothetical protein